MSNDDIGYYQRRAETELGQAERATSPEVMRAHSELANAYLERIAEVQPVNQA